MTKYRFYTCDVFTDTRFGGNPLAVLPDAEGLTTEQMQLIAREFNFSESTFVLPAENNHTNRLRIFTREREMPFAGHPNVGSAFVLAATGALGEIGNSAEITFEEIAGVVAITIRNEPGKPTWCEIKAPETLSMGDPIPVELIANALSLSPDDIVTTTHQPQTASVGAAFVVTELKNRDALERSRINADALPALSPFCERPAMHLYVRSNDEFDIRARMFAGVNPEDPATGSANCALVGLLSHYEAAESGDFSWRIAQGVEMGRPSVLDGRTRKQDGQVTGVWMAGTSVMVTEGYIDV